MSPRSVVQAVLGIAAVAYGLGAEIVATRHGQATTFPGSSDSGVGLELIAGWTLAMAGLATWRLRPPSAVGPLVVVAGFVWFAPDWAGWEGGPRLLRSVGMFTTDAWLPLLIHATLAFPNRRLPSSGARALVAALYVESAIVSLARALFRDPFYDPNCWINCTDNSLLVRPEGGLVNALGWFDLRFRLAVVVAFGALAAWRLASTTRPGRRLLVPTLAAGTALTGVSAAHAVVLLGAPLEDPREPAFALLFAAQCFAAIAVALALGWGLAHSRLAAKAVERLAVDLSDVPEPGALEAALARASGDPSLRIAFRLRHAERHVDSQGRTVLTPSSSSRRTVTPILRDGEPVAVLEHDPLVLDDLFLDRIGSAARLAVENERLRAEALAQLLELRASRARIVATGDTARRRLERDLHDGAQQRLVGLSFALRLAVAKLGPEPDLGAVRALVDAEHALGEALAAVRAVANGLFPAALASSGLAYAVEELAELGQIRLDIAAVPDGRLPALVEAAAYGVIREAVENAALHARARAISISAARCSDVIVVDAADDGIGGADPELGVGLLDVTDRVGALGGRLTIQSPAGGGTRIHAEIPCA